MAGPIQPPRFERQGKMVGIRSWLVEMKSATELCDPNTLT